MQTAVLAESKTMRAAIAVTDLELLSERCNIFITLIRELSRFFVADQVFLAFSVNVGLCVERFSQLVDLED